MKKTIYVILLIGALIGLTLGVSAQTPIATKNIGVDSVTTLEQRINVWKVIIDAQTETVTVVYDIETLAPNGVVVSTIENKIYTRLNLAGDLRFDALRSSAVGQMIAGMIAADLNNYPNLAQ